MVGLLSQIKFFYRQLVGQIQKRPMRSFLVVLGLLLLAIIASKALFTPKVGEEKKAKIVKEVETYSVSSVPKISFQGQVKKIGVVKLLSQTAGVVQSVNVSEGQEVSKGTNLINLSTTYSGGNAAAVSAQIVSRQLQNIYDTFDTQKDLISNQRDLANTMRENSSNLATISAQSKGETQSLINLNQSILDTLNNNLTNLQAINPNDPAIIQIQQAISGLTAGQNQLQSAFRNLDYLTNTGNPSQHLIDLQRDVTLKSLDIQEKSLEMNRDITRLQVNLANISASLFHPTSPIEGKIERIFVHPMDLVSPGIPLATIVGTDKSVQVLVQVPESAAGQLSRLEEATIHLKGRQENLTPSYISSEATDGRLNSVIFNLPENDYELISDGDFVSVDLPLGSFGVTGEYFVPLDTVTQTADQSLVYAVEKGKAVAKKIKLGNVSGKFVAVTSGLNGGEKVILNRNIVEGDEVKPL